MTLSPLLVLGIVANMTSITVGLALLMLVLWQSHRQQTNLLFCLFLLAMIAGAVTGLVFRLSPVFGYDPTYWLYGLGLALGAYGPLLFIFTGEFTAKGTRPVRILYIVGIVLWLVTFWLMWQGRVITNVNPTLTGRTLFDLTPLGYTLVAILIAYEGLALANLVIHPTDRSRALIPAVLVLLAAAVGDLWPLIAHLPVNSVMTAISSIIMGRAILKFQLFDPVARLNRELADANQQMAITSRLKSEFLANMSHELRTPLNSIIGYTELVLDGLYGPLTDKQQDRLEKVHRNGRSLLALINDILDLSKIEAGRLELDRVPLNVHSLIDSVMATVQPQAEEKGLEIKRVLPHYLPSIVADENRFQQILLNLLSNAVKFTSHGEIVIAAGTSRDEQKLEIQITDTGIGIAPESFELIFDEFRQVDSTSTREYGGTGLGLAISRRLARLHGGDILVESAVGKGSTFTVVLPLKDAQAAPVSDPSST